ncbi:VWA domain-containing protein [Hydrogenimonas sp.]
MRFLYPEFLYLMLIPAALLIYLVSTNRDVVERIFDAKALDRLRISGDSLGRRGHNLLAFVAFFFMTLALAQPVIEQGEIRIKSREADLVIALDLSRSMRTRDFYPDRLAFAKQKLEETIPQLPAGRIGMIGFTSASFVVAPLTEDRGSLLFLLRRLKPENISTEGTDLSAALKGAEKLLEKSRSKRVLLVTDGGDESDMDRLRKEVKASGIELNVWMVATRRGGPVPAPGDGMMRDTNKTVVISRANTALRSVAEESGGVYVEATLSQRDERAIISRLKGGSGSGTLYEKVVQRRIELFYYPLLLALLVLPFALYSVGVRQGAKMLLPLVLLPIFSPIQRAEAGVLDFRLIERAEKAYAKGEFDTSVEALERLSAVSPGNEVWFDLASGYYKSGRYKKALETYGKIATADRKLEMAKLYDMANCYVRIGDLQRAAKLYRDVLNMGADPDAKANLDLVLKLLRERKRKQQGAGGEKAGQKRKSEGSAEKGSEAKDAKPGLQKGGAVSRKLSEAEEKKWLRLIEKQPLKSKLYPLTPPKEGKNVKPW